MTSTPARGRALLATLLVGSLLAACTGDDSSDPDPGPTSPAAAELPSPPPVEERWTSGAVQDAAELMLRPGPAEAETLVLSDDRKRVVGLDAATGAVAWEWSPGSGAICNTSTEVNAAGVLGVLLDDGPGDCVDLAALDTTTGKLLWRRKVPGRPPYWQGFRVEVGERTVVAEMFCDEVVRYAADTGRHLGTLAPHDRKCAMESAIGEGLIAVLNDPETSETPDDHGTGWIPRSTDRVTRELYDADTGKLRWRVPMSNAGASLDAVVSADPPVLVWTRLGQRMAQVFDERGRPGVPVGLRLPSDDGTMVAVGEHDGVLVVRHGEIDPFTWDPVATGSATYAVDLATGEQRWRLPDEAGEPVGIVDGRVVLARVVERRDDDEGPNQEVWLSDREVAADGDAALRSLGSVPATGPEPVAVLGIVGADLLVTHGDRVHAVPVPTDGEDAVYDAPPAFGEPEESAWADDDVRPEDAVGACRTVGDDTLAGLGFVDLDLPDPLECSWRESYRPEYLDRRLSVSVEAVAPGLSMDGDELTAVEAAQERAESLVESLADDQPSYSRSSGWSVDAGVEGVLGDVVWSALGSDLGPLESTALVRWRNVLVKVTAGQEVRIEDRRPGGVPDSALAQGVHDAVADVLTTLGAETTAAEPVVEPHAAAPDVCAVLAEPVSALVGGQGRDDSPGLQAPAPESFCSWAGDDVTASVQLTAADPLDGASATEAARELFDLTASGRAVPGLGDRAVLRTDGFDDDSPYATVSVQVANALVRVAVFDVDGLRDRDAAVQGVTALARRLVGTLD